MLNTYGGNNQIEHWIRCMVADELKQRDYDFVRRICKEVIKDHVLNGLNIIVSPKNERCVCENRVPSRKDGLYLIYGNGHAEPFTGDNSKDCVRYIGLKHRYMSFAISLTEHDIILLQDVLLDDKIVTDHLWFDLTKGFESADLLPGDVVEFCARVSIYEKGYKGYRNDVFDRPIEKDYRLLRPTKIKKIGKKSID